MSESEPVEKKVDQIQWLTIVEPMAKLQIIRACLERLGVEDIGIGFPQCFLQHLPPAATPEQITHLAVLQGEKLPVPLVTSSGATHTPINECAMYLTGTLSDKARVQKGVGEALAIVARSRGIELKIPQRSFVYQDWPAALDWNFWLHQLVTRSPQIFTWPPVIVGELLRWTLVWSGAIEKPDLRGRTAEWQLVVLGMILENLDASGTPKADFLSRCLQTPASPPVGGGMTDQQLNDIAASLAGGRIPGGVAASRQAILAHLPAAKVSDLRLALQAAGVSSIVLAGQNITVQSARKSQLLDFLRKC